MIEEYHSQKIARVIERAFHSVGNTVDADELTLMVTQIEEALKEDAKAGISLHVEDIQDLVEKTLIERNYYHEVKSFILYREDRKRKRRVRAHISEAMSDVVQLDATLKDIQRDFPDEAYHLEYLDMKFRSFFKENMHTEER